MKTGNVIVGLPPAPGPCRHSPIHSMRVSTGLLCYGSLLWHVQSSAMARAVPSLEEVERQPDRQRRQQEEPRALPRAEVQHVPIRQEGATEYKAPLSLARKVLVPGCGGWRAYVYDLSGRRSGDATSIAALSTLGPVGTAR